MTRSQGAEAYYRRVVEMLKLMPGTAEHRAALYCARRGLYFTVHFGLANARVLASQIRAHGLPKALKAWGM